uniref:Cyclin-D1-binding protein 1 n=2 Tax=Rhizophora mucronata TaxID=61149 RepID=A0A2P2JSJ7_RHIMU
MGKAEKERLNQTLSRHISNIHETLQVLEQTTPPSSPNRGSWEEVLKMGDQVSKEATIVGMLWTGETPQVKAIEENMETYFNMLQGLLLISHGIRVGAGPTLSSGIHASLGKVVDSSFKLMIETVSSNGSSNKDFKLTVPQLVGAVWEACSALKKTPSTNITAIGRAMTQVAVSVKDVLREMKELKPSSSNQTDEATDASFEDSTLQDNDNVSDDDLGNDLSDEEMKIVQSAIGVVSETIAVIKELIRTITSLLKQEKPVDTGNFVDSLEKLLKLCQDMGVLIDEIGASLYPPQEISAIRAALEKMSSMVSGMQAEVENLTCSSGAFLQACGGLRSSIKQMESELECPTSTDVVDKMQNLVVDN